MTTRLAIRITHTASWMGGVNYLLNLCRILRAHAPAIEPVVFAAATIDESLRRRITLASGNEPIDLPERSRTDDLKTFLGIPDRQAASFFRQHAIDVVFESTGFYGRNPGFRTLSWLPDFQHRHLPHLFTRSQWLIRETRTRCVLSARRNILVSSEDSFSDLRRFYGRPRGKVHVVPFSIRLEDDIGYDDAEAIRIRHGLPEDYIFLPNQFWAHKNHAVVVEALGLMGEAAPVIVATGGTRDPRSPDLFHKLSARVKELSVEEKFRILGQIPYRDTLGLNARANYLINPSRFEGWSTTVEEAKALGTPLLLSDLSVHREQAGADARYFDTGSPQDCAAILAGAAKGPRRSKSAQTFDDTDQRLFARRFGDAVRATIETG